MSRLCEFACGRPVTCAYVTLDEPGLPHFVCAGCYTQAVKAALAGKQYLPREIPVQTAECLDVVRCRREERQRVWLADRVAPVVSLVS